MSVEVLTEPSLLADSVTIHLRPAFELTDEQFFTLCQINGNLRLERTAHGDLIVMPPTGGETGNRNADITTQLYVWAKRNGTGAAFDSSTGFKLPDGADRSPDVSWITRERLAQLTPEQKKKFIPLCPDFVLELRSPTDNIEAVQAKMREYMENGARLGLLIDPLTRRVHIYRPDVATEILENPQQVSGESVLAGFTLDLREIWQPNI